MRESCRSSPEYSVFTSYQCSIRQGIIGFYRVYVIYHYLAWFSNVVTKHWIILYQSAVGMYIHSNGF